MPPTFQDLGVSPALLARLDGLGFSEPTPIQVASLPDSLAGRDVLGRAPTGSGKTLAFGLAIAQHGATSPRPRPRRPVALVLTPTRELAAQVSNVIESLGGGASGTLAVYGGTSYGPQRAALKRGVATVVACPGRLEDLIAQGAVDLGAVSIVVLDEADRMADMGFLPAVRRLLDLTASSRQVLLFSATLGKEVMGIASSYQCSPVHHNVDDAEEPAQVAHRILEIPREHRLDLLAGIIYEHGRALVFCRTRRGADRVARQLKALGVEAVAIHGDRTQAQRERALASFSRGSARALVATDVAARGIHVDDLPCVVHFDPPADSTDYVHRSGRTGRAGKSGTVVSLVTPDQVSSARRLQRSLGYEARVEPGSHGLRRTLTVSGTSPGRTVGSPGGQPSGSGAELHQGPVPARSSGRAPALAASSNLARNAAPEKRGTNRSSIHRKRSNKGVTHMPTGTVKFFNSEKGYGFLSQPDGEDVFVHYSNVEGSGFRTLEAGQQVEFEIAPGRKGDEARNVRVI